MQCSFLLKNCYRWWKVRSPGLKPMRTCCVPNDLTTKPLRPDILTDIHTPLNLVTKWRQMSAILGCLARISGTLIGKILMPNLLPNACLQGISNHPDRNDNIDQKIFWIACNQTRGSVIKILIFQYIFITYMYLGVKRVTYLHVVTNCLSFWQNLAEILGP